MRSVVLFLVVIVLVLVLSLVVLVDVFLLDLLEEFLWEETQQLPGDVERLEDVSGVVGSLLQELVLEFVEELKVQAVLL